MKEEAIIGCILGTAVGDALGLPYEGLRPSRASKMFAELGRHYFFFGKGMVSDDTEHACFVAQALIASPREPADFERRLAWALRWWLLGLPAGVGFATLKSILKLWLGVSPGRSGVFSAGNGPAMRGPVLGVALGASPDALKEFVKRSTRITHIDPKAYFGAMGAALAAFQSAASPQTSSSELLRLLDSHLKDESAEEFLELIDKAAESAERGEAVSQFAESIGSSKGISGYIYHTLPCVIQTWLRHQKDFAGGLRDILSAGGDTDTTGAILGGIIGAGVGKEGIPPAWLDGIMEWPRTIKWMEKLGGALSQVLDGRSEVNCPSYFFPGIILRNALFLLVVLAHGLRRLAPPY
jgi:ADP-ribosylglycohydrolase